APFWSHIIDKGTIKTDCDYDTLLIEVEQVGGSACHTGARPCFFNQIL
ncbi:phosphoribosyl-AMP cyclohydrolase, partial [Streptococcus hyointestinalis]